ncbi:hypothetical protein [Proteiniphilum sp.]|uniref:hypothetical protein n=1 Tax=Proteiniphilum sp. TaxID=1926877 RepID=UPI002B1EE349|nr:hypothetical protein [Proteiniphilum sp.]MEA4915904.1 hypothetical protein [Proteiniphilum sp.]
MAMTGKLSVVYKSGTTTTASREYVGNKVYNNGTPSKLLRRKDTCRWTIPGHIIIS